MWQMELAGVEQSDLDTRLSMVRPQSNLSIKWFKSQAFGVLGHNRADSVVLSVKAFWYLAIISGGSGAQLAPLGVGWLGRFIMD